MGVQLLPWALAGLGFFTSVAHAFSMTVGTPTQCDDLTVSWTGGKAPFQILLTPVFDIARNISVPSSAFANNQGSYTIPQLPLVSNDTFLLTMSDATGFASGGTTSLLTVGKSIGNNTCNTTSPAVAFYFDLEPGALYQCDSYTFSGYMNAVQPVTISALVESGNSFVISPPASSVDRYSWTADVEEGSSIVFVMTDADGRQGGSSNVTVVGASGSTECLSTTSTLSTTPTTPPQTPTGTATTSSPASTSTSSAGVSMATVAGAVAGSVVASAAVFAAALCCLRKRQTSRLPPDPYAVHDSPPRRRRGFGFGRRSDVPHIQPFPYHASPASQLIPLMHPESAYPSAHNINAPAHLRQQSWESYNRDGVGAYRDSGVSSTSSLGRVKVVVGGTTVPHHTREPTRFVRHTDVEDAVLGENRVVELPPHYSERRRPLAALHLPS
ncbi:hypothetical protein BV22DRAFT_130605 [Leucogyrophana mollusca]|uniref:Uncharacterized protein n=1 Tax=Leucogyrophana mollusca TaxID=85980 RepID=A0ACB8BVK9_9AGAM|nr:hypothetical protein BV22DRAFT_130605 [Leucogyrophana mollusca]